MAERGGRAPTKRAKKYLIALEETRSIVAAVAGAAIFFCTLAAVFAMIARTPDTEENALHYFTVLSNLLSATGAAFMFPYAVEGVRKKRFVLPRWVVLFQYAGATCVAITMVASLVLILPTRGLAQMTGPNFWLHVVTPVCTVLLFQCVETGIAFTRRDMLISLAPFGAYALVYTVMAVLIGKARGGWSDFYMTQAYWPAWVSLLLIAAIAVAVSAALRALRNRRAAQSRARIARAWSADTEPVRLLVEAFGLGRSIGRTCSEEELTVPLDIFAMMAERYGVPVERLAKAYLRGALDAIAERRNR